MYKRLIQEAPNDMSFKVHSKLHPKIWNGMEMDKTIRDRTMDIAAQFDEFMAQPKLKLVDVVIVGSMANYNYTDDSDMDIHLIYDVSDMEGKVDMADLFATKRYLWQTKHEIFLKGIPVEVSPQGNKGETGKLQSDGMFSLKNNKWLKKPEQYSKKQKDSIDDVEIRQAGDVIIAKIRKILANKSDTVSLTIIQQTFTDLKNLRKKGLAKKDGELAFENLVYKYVRGKGYVHKLLDHIDRLTDAQLSM